VSYDPALLSARDRVRFAVGDTGALYPEFLPDATYDAMLATFNGDEQRAIYAAAGALLTQVPQRITDVGTTVDLGSWITQLRGLVAAQQQTAVTTAQAFRTRSPVRADRLSTASEYRREDGAW
jgi:hypothetical protein